MTEFIVQKVLFITDDEKAQYSNSDDDTSSDYTPSHQSDSDDECF